MFTSESLAKVKDALEMRKKEFGSARKPLAVCWVVATSSGVWGPGVRGVVGIMDNHGDPMVVIGFSLPSCHHSHPNCQKMVLEFLAILVGWLAAGKIFWVF